MQDLQLLPRRNSQQRVKFTNVQEQSFYSNLYEVQFSQKNNTVYQFVVETTPEIPQDSAHLYKLIYRNINKQLKQKLKDVIESGTMIWGFQNLSKPTIFQCQFTEPNSENVHKYDVLVKPVKQMDFYQMMKQPKTKKMILQISNSKIKGTLRNYLHLSELSPGKYFEQKPDLIKNLGLEIRKGYKMTLCPIGNQLLMQIDVCSKISRSDNFLRQIAGMNPQTAKNTYKDSIVITRYGKLRTYRIQDIAYDLNPNSKFYSDKQAGQITYAKYYQVSYGIKITDMRQPLLYVLARVQKKIQKEKIVEKPFYVYLIPELVSLTGMSDQHKANHNAMKQIAPFTKLQPRERVEANQKIAEEYNKDKTNDFIKIKGQKNARGVVLDGRKVQLGDGNTMTNGGTFMFKNKIFSPAKFKDWVIVYSLSNKPDLDDKDADNVESLIKKSAGVFGIQVANCGFIAVQGRIPSDWKTQIQEDFKKNGKPQIVVLLFQKNQQKFYGQLKRFLTCQKKVPSQAIRRRTLSGPPPKNLSAASKILLQMNAKLGLPLWQIANQPFGKSKVMYGAISMSKGANGFTLAFVGTIDKNCTKVYSQAVVGIKKKEQISQTIFDSIFKNWAKTYYKNTKSVPDIIIIYREGLAQAQIEKFVKPQIRSLQKTVQTIAAKVKIENYNPKLLFIGVNKKITMRFYKVIGKQSGSKFIPNLSNPQSGSVVVEDFSIGNLTDFHLAAQKVTQGTCTPTQYIIIYKNFDLNLQDLIQFTYSQCFNYYNWTGAVRVPACLQCADKLAKLVGQSIKENIPDLGQMSNSYHFL